MKFQKISPFIFLMILVSCQNTGNPSSVSNDTTKVLEISITEGISVKFMPSASALRRNYFFGDSILLTSEFLPLNLLPKKLNNQSFKILPKEQVCTVINVDHLHMDFPNYLIVRRFEKNDSGYYVQLQNLSCIEFGGGGSLGLYFRKTKDSITIVNRSSSSIN